MSLLLELRGINKSFPGVNALSNIHLSLQTGEIQALLGENGAGKSTLMKILCGIYSNDEGQIFMNGSERVFNNYNEAIAAGIGIIFQEFSLIPYLNAVDNIFLNREITNKLGLLDRKLMRIEAKSIFDTLGIDIDLDIPIAELSIADQQFIEITKALSLNAKLLVLDEPTATLTPTEAERLFAIMRDLKSRGVGMFFISHHLEEIFEVCDTVSVLRDGEYISTKRVKETNVDELVEMMVGRKLDNAFPKKTIQSGKKQVVLSVPEIQINKSAPINQFELYQGEILGFSGLVGSGRSELVRALIGADHPTRKQVFVMGQELSLNSPSEALHHGIGLLPESRKTEGLVMDFSIKENILLNNHQNEIYAWTLLDRSKEKNVALNLMNKVRVKAPDEETQISNLSGGNQQKVVIARWLNNDCNILIFDEPTRGIDVGAKSEIYELMKQLTAQGISIIMISSELPEVIGVCDRVLVFNQGAIVASLEGEDIESNTIMLHATGQAA
ncbi:sugar ABC transporter ATP-binding protein [Vibrio sp. S12_S33]|uniref:sugar ABC transporter ATP-binding protein n=1 Tax=Vibrio sp. S12_S33 TaxID=2720223 RepID=UPI001781A2A0|nr:sugar ABC transporter ATP-binding protein [Vibrio sp. S12_S33]MBD1567294.1 sugar ABC transporter ATP-binding protein [Vibrio sp. S12_S33]